MIKGLKNRQGGFFGLIKLLIFIGGVLFVMSYFNISVSDVVNWFKDTF